MRKALLLIASAWLLAAAREPEPLSPTAFRDRFAAAIAAATGSAARPVDDYTLSAKTTDGTDLTIHTDNAYAAYRADPAQIDTILARYVRTLTDAGDAGHESIDQLIVIVRPTDYLSRSVPSDSRTPSGIQPRPMAGDLSYFLAVDSPDSIRTASRSDLKRWHVDEAAAWTRAFANLAGRISPLSVTHLGSEDGASGIGAASGLAPSLLADPSYCAEDQPAGANAEIALVYAKDFFLFAIPSDKTMTARFWAAVKAETAAGRSLSSTPIVCRNGHWVALSIP